MLQSITERVLAAAVVLCIVISGSLGIALKVEHARYTVAATQLEQAKRDTEQARKERDAQIAALNKLKTQLDKLRSDEASAKGKLNEALNANADWSNARVPDSVFDSIFAEPASGSAAR
ncbi:Rz [Burkholderia phage JG068]|uniref:Rz n=1 Tax=Burkholderia phage JG068 TaxID=1401297 RepID=U3PIR4_9CAUD|nr:Rz-like spanin [Burkholderia phage JG068]AGW43630.1 Rz [Burkholderia phage JG068]